MNQDYKLDDIEEEMGNQSADQIQSEDSSQSEGLFQSQKQIKKARVFRDRILYCERLVKAFSSYLQFLSGQQLSDEEQKELKMSLGTCTPSRLNQLSDEYQYITEFDYHMGDLVLVFPNPDSHKNDNLGTMTQLEAVQLCLTCFTSNKSATELEVMDNLILIKAIEQVIYTLNTDDDGFDNFYDDEDRQKQSEGEEEGLLNNNNTDDSKRKPSNNYMDSNDRDDATKGSKKLRYKLRRWGGSSNYFGEAILRLETKLKEIYDLDNTARQTAIKEAFNLNNVRLDRFTRIQMSRGKFLSHDTEKDEWIRTTNTTKDFTTLMRLVVMLQLSKLGFLMRQFISKNGQSIFLVLYQSDYNLKILAHKYKLPKSLNSSFQDLLSYEPVDESFRPYRLNNRLWRPTSEYKDQLTRMFIYLKPKIVALLEKINYKQIAREINQSTINQQMFVQGDEEIVDDSAPTDETWKCYYAYLIYLESKITKFRKDFKISNQNSLIINRSLKPYEIYMNRNPDKLVYQDQINEHDINLLEEILDEKDIEDQIDLNGRSPELLDVFIGIHKIYQEQNYWQKYYDQVKSLCNIASYKLVTTRDIKVLKKSQTALHYKELFQEALQVTNYDKMYLKTIWDFAGLLPFDPFVPFTLTSKKLSKNQQSKLTAVWKQYCNTETKRISVFSNMERIKINNMASDEKINFTILISEKFMKAKFCLNDNYEIFGKSNKHYFSPLFNSNYKLEAIKNESYYNYFYQEAKAKKEKGYFGPNKYENQEYIFAEKKLENLAYLWRFQWNHPWDVPVKQVRDYYGEKLAIYFTFVGFNASNLFIIGILGLGISIQEYIIFDSKNPIYIYTFIVFGFLQIQWGNLMHDMWQTIEKVFAIQFGQFSSTGEDDTQQRSSFYGYFQRSIESDNLNILFFPDGKKVFKKLFTSAILLGMIALYVGVIVGIFVISDVLQNVDAFTTPQTSVVLFQVTIPAIINLIIVMLLDGFFDKLATILTDYENQKTIKMYEANFIQKKFFLCFFSMCIPILEVQFLHTRFGLHCAKNDCLQHSAYHYATMFIIQFLVIVYKKTHLLIYSFLKHFVLELLNKNKKKTNFSKLNLEIQHQPLKSVNKLSNLKSGPQSAKPIAGQSRSAHSSLRPQQGLQSSPTHNSIASSLKPQEQQGSPPHNSIASSLKPQGYQGSPPHNSVASSFKPQQQQLQFFPAKDMVKLEDQDKLLDDDEDSVEEGQKRKDPFEKINHFIEDDFEKDSYVISPERYGTVDDFMEIAIQHAMLVLFGTTFPLSYTIAFLRSLLELQSDKLKLFNEMQRPIPISESTIGVWNTVFDGLAYLSLVVNCGSITSKRDHLVDSNPIVSSTGFFLICILLNFFARFVEVTIFSELPFLIQNLLKRQAYLIKTTIEKFRGSSDKSTGKTVNSKSLKRYPILKIYGCKTTQEIAQRELVELSSDSDVEEHVKRLEEIRKENTVDKPKKKKPKVVVQKIKAKKQKDEEVEIENEGEEEQDADAKLLQQANNNKEQSIEELQKYFNSRASNWALRFKMKESLDKEVQLMQKIFFQKTLTYLKLKDQLNPHQKQWTLDRFTHRKFFLPRYLVLIRNLDWRRYLIFTAGDKRLKDNLKQQQNKKYEKQLEFLNSNLDVQQNIVEKMEIVKKKKDYVEKHLWTDGRSTIMLRSGGVWFSQFRKSTRKVAAIKIAENYASICEQFKKVCKNEMMSAKTSDPTTPGKVDANYKPIDEQFFNLTCNLTNTQLKKFSTKSLQQLLDNLDIKHKENLIYPVTSKGVSQVEYQLDNYLTQGLRKQFKLMNFSYVPYRIQAPFLKINSMLAWDLFVEEQLNMSQPRINLISRIDKKTDTFASKIQTNVYAAQPQNKRWLMTFEQDPMRKDISLYFVTEITHSRIIHRDIVNRVYRFYDQFEGPDYSEMSLPIAIAKLVYFKLIKSNQILNLRDPLLKGYICRAYNPPRNSIFCNGLTLKDVIQSRKTKYTDSELSNFINSMVTLLQFLEVNMGMYHGSLNTSNLFLVQRLDKQSVQQYTTVDLGLFYWYDHKEEKTYFTRAIEQNDELWFMSPELLHNYLNPNNQLSISPQKSDMYSLGMISLQMATLGQMKLEVESQLTEWDGDVGLTVRKWMMHNKNQIIHDYPNSSQMILQLLHPDQKLRLYPSMMAAKLVGKASFEEHYSFKNYDENLAVISQKRFHPQFGLNILTELENESQVQITLKSYLKQSIFAFEQYLILGQIDQCFEQCDEFERNISEQYFQSTNGDVTFFDSFRQYCYTKMAIIIEQQLDEFKYFIMYFTLRIQLQILAFEMENALLLSTGMLELLKEIEIFITIFNKQCESEDQIENSCKAKFTCFEEVFVLIKTSGAVAKFLRTLPHKFKFYVLQFQTLAIQVYYLTDKYQLAKDLCLQYIQESFNEIKYDLKYSQKEGTHFLIEERLLIKLFLRLQVQFCLAQIQFDSFDNNCLTTTNELNTDLILLQSFLQHDKEHVDKQSPIKPILKQSKTNLMKDDFIKSSFAAASQSIYQVHFIQLLLDNQGKNFDLAAVRIKHIQKQLSQQKCVFEQLKCIPIQGWIGQHFSETNQKEMIELYKTVCAIMEEQYIIGESFVIEGTIYFPYIQLVISNLVHYCTQLLYYNSIAISNGIYQGFMQLIQKHHFFEDADLLKTIIKINILFVLIENQQHQYPYYLKTDENQIDYTNHIPDDILNKSLIVLIKQTYQTILPYLSLTETQPGNSWLLDKKLSQLILELLYGFIFAQSKQNMESEKYNWFDLLKITKKTIDYVNVDIQNNISYVEIENGIMLTRILQLAQDHEAAQQQLTKTYNLLFSLQQHPSQTDQYQQSISQLMFAFYDVVVNNVFYSNGSITFKEMFESDEGKFIKKHPQVKVSFFILKLLDLFLKNQQIEINLELLKLFDTLLLNKAKIFKKEGSNFSLAINVFKLRTYALQEELRQYIEKNDKQDNVLIQDIFANIQTIFNKINNKAPKKGSRKKVKLTNVQDVSRLLLAQQLELSDMNQISASLVHMDDKEQGFENQVTLCQLGVKLITYQLHAGSFRDADSMAYNIKRKLFDLIYFEVCKMAICWQSEKIFLIANQTEISVNQLFKSLNIHEQKFENYEHNLLTNIKPIKSIAINVRNFLVLKQILFMRLLYSYVEGLQALAIIMRGDFKLSKQNLAYVQYFGESDIEEISALVTNVMMLFDITTSDFQSASFRAIKLLQILQQRQKQTTIVLKVSTNARAYHPIEIDQIIQVTQPEIQFHSGAEISFSYEETLTKTALRPYFEIPKLTTEAYLSYLEALIQMPKRLSQAADPIFYAQKYVQQQYGLSHIFYGHLQRLIASMYAEFLINKRMKDLEEALVLDSGKKIIFLKQEIMAKTRVYLESRVKNKCTLQMEKKYQETKQFLKNKIKVFQGINEGISPDIVSRWALQAANESLIIYLKYCNEFRYESNPYLGFLYSAYADIYFVQNKLVSTQQQLEKVKATLEYCYTSISNPDYCRFFYRLGYLRLNVLNILKLYAEALVGLSRLNPSQKFEVLLSVISEQVNFLQHFDQFCSHGFFLFLEINILRQMEKDRILKDLTQSYRKDQQDLIRYLQIEGEKLAFQKTIDQNSRPYPHIIEAIYKDGMHLVQKQIEKFNPDYTGLELFIKSFQICKLLLTSDNTIYQKVLFYVNKLNNRKASLI